MSPRGGGADAAIAELVFARFGAPRAVPEVVVAARLRAVPLPFLGLAAALLVGAAALCLRLDLVLAYNDSRSHLLIARRTWDSVQPGVPQLGTVWLPLPHILLVPFTTVDELFWSGAAGAIVGVAVTLYGVICLFRLISIWTGARGPAWIAAGAYLLNANLLYLQSTALSEPIFIGLVMGALYHLGAWLRTWSYRDLLLAGALTTAASLVRYDAWLLAVAGFAVVLLATYRRTERRDAAEAMTISYAVFAGSGALLWLFYNFTIFGDPLYFQHSAYSAQAQQQGFAASGLLPDKGHLVLSAVAYSRAVLDVCGPVLAAAAVAGWSLALLGRDRGPALALLALAATPLIFNVLSLYAGQSLLFLPELDGGRIFNVRYGINSLPLLAIGIGLLAAGGRWRTALAAAAVVVQAALWVVSGVPITVQDGLQGISSGHGPDPVAAYLHAHYRGGRILVDDYTAAPTIFSTRIPLREFVDRSVPGEYGPALEAPAAHVRWVVFQPGDEVDGVVKGQPRRLDGFHQAGSFVVRGQVWQIWERDR